VDMDKEITFERSGSVEDMVELLDEFGPRARVRCMNAELWSFLNKMITTKLGRRDKDGIAGLFLNANPEAYRFTAPRNLMLTPMGKEFMERMEEFINEPAGHIVALCSFTLGDAAATRSYIADYAKLICTDTAKKKTDALTSVIYLREMLADGSETNDIATDKLVAMYKPGELLRQMDELLSACQKELCEFKTDGITDKLVTQATKDFGKRTAKMLEKMLREAQEVYKENHKGINIFSKLFSGLKKK